jgi:23S rRNA pseudouridine1911/1915/1917 synthase
VRLDALIGASEELSRSRAQRLIRDGHVRLNGVPASKVSATVHAGDRVEVEVPEPEPLALAPWNVPLNVLFEDDDVVVLNKAPGMVVHPAPGHRDDTLVNALLAHCAQLSGIGGVQRPGIVHRLDADTSGVMVVAKSDVAHAGLSAQLAAHTVEREYLALVAPLRGPGLDPDGGTIATLHGRDPRDRKRFTSLVEEGRHAVTHYRIDETYPCGALRVVCRLETGRTHQIRVHFAERGCPLIGDRVYGGRAMRAVRLIDRHALHARVLGFEHPRTGAWLRFEGGCPDDFERAQDVLRRGGDWR